MPKSEDWEEDTPPYFGYRFLTVEARNRLRAAIRQEEKERMDGRMRYVTIIAAITGLMGGVIGIIATLKQ